jgi:ATP-dependent DNA helicase DinG
VAQARPEIRADADERPISDGASGDVASGNAATAPAPGPTPGLTIDAVLGPDGILAACVPHYEDRPAQRHMAEAVATALDDERVLLVEAGTGTGKTLAYLVPALLSGKRVVVSTGTRALQDQITRHDIPLLEELMPRQFTAVTLKGVSNYLCLRKLYDGAALAALRTEEARRDFAVIADWARETATGDRAEVESVADDAAVWSVVTNTPDTRLGPRCPYYEQCFVTRARRRAEKADIIVVNHHLFFADLALRSAYPGARVLPEYEAVIFDEAHQLEDVMTDHFGVQISTVRLAQLARDAHHAFAGPSGPLFMSTSTSMSMSTGAATGASPSTGSFSSHRPGRASERIIEHVERSAEGFFAAVRRALAERAPGEGGRIAIDDDLFADQARQDAWFRLDTALDELAAHAALTAEDLGREQAAAGEPGGPVDERAEALDAVARRAAGMRDDLALLAERSERAFVYWGELRGTSVMLCAAPVDVSPYMRQHVVPQAPALVLTSATLRAGASFDYVRQRLGLDHELADERTVPSPFDYTRQAMLYLPRDLPDPREPGFVEAACARITELCAITGGRAFVLFTSHRALREAARRLTGALPHELLVQGDMPRAALLERFRGRPGSVLLGTGTFWEGVDVPGDALSLVIVDKLPFAPHTDPLIRARMQRIESEQGEAFDTYQLPQAALTLKQGFGRLIRRGDDRGIVAVLDHRIVMRRYGRVFLDTLPEALPRTSVLEQVRRWWHGPAPALAAPAAE